MKIKTSELNGVALDWAVAQVAGEKVHMQFGWTVLSEQVGDSIEKWSPSTRWSQGGPLIEDFEGWGISIMRRRIRSKDIKYCHAQVGPEEPENETLQHGETALIAACRAIVAARLGEEVEIPDELCDESK